MMLPAENGSKITVHLIKQAFYRQLPLLSPLKTGEVEEDLVVDEVHVDVGQARKSLISDSIYQS